MNAMRTVCVFYFVSAPCHVTTLHLAAKGYKRGVFNRKVDLIIHELNAHTLLEVVDELLRGVKGFGR